jgi:hypothetical protein
MYFRNAVKDAARAGASVDAAHVAEESLTRLAAALRNNPRAAKLLLARHGIPLDMDPEASSKCMRFSTQ